MSTTRTLPETIGGFQHLEPDCLCRAGDIYVLDGKPIDYVIEFVGETVGLTERHGNCRVYRKMPVAHQHDPL